MGFATTYKRGKMYVHCTKESLIDLKWGLREGTSDLEALIAATGVSLLGFANPITGILAFSLTTAYGIMSVIDSRKALATQLEREIDTMNNGEYSVTKFEVEFAYSPQNVASDKPDSMEALYLEQFENTGNTRYSSSELIEFIENKF